MKFLELVTDLLAGHIIKGTHSKHDALRFYKMEDDRVYLSHDGIQYALNGHVDLNSGNYDWEIYKPPPTLISWEEALTALKEGKVVVPEGGPLGIKLESLGFYTFNVQANHFDYDSEGFAYRWTFMLAHFESKWYVID